MAASDVMPAIAGGALIGGAAAALYLLNGRIAGINGILNGAVLPTLSGDRTWRFVFLAGLILGSYLVRGVATAPSVTTSVASPALLLMGGLLVGFGARMGNGCTSGHGVCGVARFSKRSVAATLTFLAAAMATVFLVSRHILEL